MNERYIRLLTLPENLHLSGSPVLIAAGALLKDTQSGRVLGQLKLQSISSMQIKAVTVELTPFDTIGEPLGEPVSHQYLDLTALRDEYFGSKEPIYFDNPLTRSYHVVVKEVIFSDNQIWTAPEGPWEPLPKRTSLFNHFQSNELVAQYKRHFGNDCAYLCQAEKDLWYCSCGAVNHQDEAACHRCKRTFTSFQNVDATVLQEEIDEQLAQKKQRKQHFRENIKEHKKAIFVVVVALITLIVIQNVVKNFEHKQNGKNEGFMSFYTYIESKGRFINSRNYRGEFGYWTIAEKGQTKEISYTTRSNTDSRFTVNMDSDSSIASYELYLRQNGTTWTLTGAVDINHYKKDEAITPEIEGHDQSESARKEEFTPICTSYFSSMVMTLSQDLEDYGLNLSLADLGFTSY